MAMPVLSAAIAFGGLRAQIPPRSSTPTRRAYLPVVSRELCVGHRSSSRFIAMPVVCLLAPILGSLVMLSHVLNESVSLLRPLPVPLRHRATELLTLRPGPPSQVRLQLRAELKVHCAKINE